MKLTSSSYQKSNRCLTVDFEPTEDCQLLAARILEETSVQRRGFLADAVVNDLCQSAELPPCAVLISDQPQKHRKDQKGRLRLKVYGFYQPQPARITIYQRTAIRRQILAPKTFLNTLLHEFLHHYDRYSLQINSLHTAGFYHRLGHLTELLI